MSIPGAANPLLLRTAAAGGYQISRSLRFNSSDSAYLSRTPASAGNRKTWTWAGWVKRSALSTTQVFYSAATDGNNRCWFGFSGDFYNGTNGDKFYISQQVGGVYSDLFVSSGVFRDPSAWYHIVVALDTSQASNTNRLKIYVNGSQIDGTLATITQNADLQWNTNNGHSLGRSENPAGFYFSGYLADIYFIDGQALTPSSFTETSATTGQLIPKAYTGTFTGNSFWLKFADNSAATATTLGKDSSGLGNNFTPTNFSVTAGAGNDSLVDTPTSYGTDTGAGGEVRGNYCTWNPLPTTTAKTFSDGNLQVVGSGTDGYSRLYGTFGMATGKWYFEVVPIAISGYVFIGISASEGNGYSSNAYYYYSATGAKTNRGAGSGFQAYGNSYTANDVIGVAVDMDTGKIWFAKNGTWQASGNPAAGTNAAYTDVLTYLKGAYVPYVTTDEYYSYTVVLNAGQRPFAYTAPSGFKALCDTNLPAPVVAKPSTVMDVKLYTGNGTSQTISGLGFSPDLVWLKARSAATAHLLFDQIRGATYYLSSNATDAESNSPSNTLTAFTSDGFTLGSNSSANGSSVSLAAWAWDAGSSTVTNTQGSITSQVRTNGYLSIVTYTAPSSGAWTVGHGLGVAPQFIITKSRSNAYSWGTYHVSVGNTGRLDLNSTGAVTTTQNSAWNNTSPTSTVFSMGSDWAGSGITYVAYCFAPVAGYSSFGSYTGNGSADGPFVYTGFRPRWILFKNTSQASDWAVYDAARSPYNVTNDYLTPNTSDAEGVDYANGNFDILANGFKIRATWIGENGSGNTLVYAAFAENPFQYARAR